MNDATSLHGPLGRNTSPDSYEAPLTCSECGSACTEDDPTWKGDTFCLYCVPIEGVADAAEAVRYVLSPSPEKIERAKEAIKIFRARADDTERYLARHAKNATDRARAHAPEGSPGSSPGPSKDPEAGGMSAAVPPVSTESRLVEALASARWLLCKMSFEFVTVPHATREEQRKKALAEIDSALSTVGR